MTTTAPLEAPWRRRWWRGTAEHLHQLSLLDPLDRGVHVMDPTDQALVLGSTQHIEGRVSGLPAIHRHSGGGAVLVGSPGALWFDLVIPAGSGWWVDDVTVFSRRMGSLWQRVLGGLLPPLKQFEGPSTPAHPVCFAGASPGELFLGDRKVLGLAQRRTRLGARVQCLLVLDGSQDDVGALLNLEHAPPLTAPIGLDTYPRPLRGSISAVLARHLRGAPDAIVPI